MTRKAENVPLIGAGIAGAPCARVLSSIGHFVQVFDTSRGPGGRPVDRRGVPLPAVRRQAGGGPGLAQGLGEDAENTPAGHEFLR